MNSVPTLLGPESCQDLSVREWLVKLQEIHPGYVDSIARSCSPPSPQCHQPTESVPVQVGCPVDTADSMHLDLTIEIEDSDEELDDPEIIMHLLQEGYMQGGSPGEPDGEQTNSPSMRENDAVTIDAGTPAAVLYKDGAATETHHCAANYRTNFDSDTHTGTQEFTEKPLTRSQKKLYKRRARRMAARRSILKDSADHEARLDINQVYREVTFSPVSTIRAIPAPRARSHSKNTDTEMHPNNKKPRTEEDSEEEMALDDNNNEHHEHQEPLRQPAPVDPLSGILPPRNPRDQYVDTLKPGKVLRSSPGHDGAKSGKWNDWNQDTRELIEKHIHERAQEATAKDRERLNSLAVQAKRMHEDLVKTSSQLMTHMARTTTKPDKKTQELIERLHKEVLEASTVPVMVETVSSECLAGKIANKEYEYRDGIMIGIMSAEKSSRDRQDVKFANLMRNYNDMALKIGRIEAKLLEPVPGPSGLQRATYAAATQQLKPSPATSVAEFKQQQIKQANSTPNGTLTVSCQSREAAETILAKLFSDPDTIEQFAGKITHHAVRDKEIILVTDTKDTMRLLRSYMKVTLREYVAEVEKRQLRNPMVEVGPITLDPSLIPDKGALLIKQIYSSNECLSVMYPTYEEFVARKLVMYIGYRRESRKVLMAMHPRILKRLQEQQQSKIKVGCFITSYKEIIVPLRCFHCLDYGHIKANCPTATLPPNCNVCAGPHLSRDCTPGRSVRCVNCLKAQRPADHQSHTHDCPIYVNRLKDTIKRTNYEGIKPTDG